MTNKDTLIKSYIKANKRAIMSNWRKHLWIRQNNNYSLMSYINSIIKHMATDIFQVNLEHKELSTFARYLYKSI